MWHWLFIYTLCWVCIWVWAGGTASCHTCHCCCKELCSGQVLGGFHWVWAQQARTGLHRERSENSFSSWCCLGWIPLFPEAHSGVKIEICNFESSVLLEQGPDGGNPWCFAVLEAHVWQRELGSCGMCITGFTFLEMQIYFHINPQLSAILLILSQRHELLIQVLHRSCRSLSSFPDSSPCWKGNLYYLDQEGSWNWGWLLLLWRGFLGVSCMKLSSQAAWNRGLSPASPGTPNGIGLTQNDKESDKLTLNLRGCRSLYYLYWALLRNRKSEQV